MIFIFQYKYKKFKDEASTNIQQIYINKFIYPNTYMNVYRTFFHLKYIFFHILYLYIVSIQYTYIHKNTHIYIYVNVYKSFIFSI